MSSLDPFLNALDLDELLNARLRITILKPPDESRIDEVIRDWSDPQAIANLLFYPDLIPESIRFEAIDRGLHSPEESYLSLACRGLIPPPSPRITGSGGPALCSIMFARIRRQWHHAHP